MIHGMVLYFATQKEPHMSQIALAEQTEQTTTERSEYRSKDRLASKSAAAGSRSPCCASAS